MLSEKADTRITAGLILCLVSGFGWMASGLYKTSPEWVTVIMVGPAALALVTVLGYAMWMVVRGLVTGKM